MSHRAWTYIWIVLLTGAVLTGLALTGLAQAVSQWPVFATLTVLTILAHLAKARGATHEAWHANLVFFFAGALLLPPSLFVLLVAIPHLIEWARERLADSRSLRNWYIQPFNIANHIIAGFAARWALTFLYSNTTSFPTLATVFIGALAAIIYLALNHALVGMALVLARGVPWRETGIFDGENLLGDLTLLVLGYVVAMQWSVNPWLVLPALTPLVLMNRALSVPRLKKEVRVDEQTGLWNARHFREMFSIETERASRLNRPLALITADLDVLSSIKATYGRAAGDAVVVGIGQIIGQNLRVYDIAARVGEEEFAIVLPETEPAEARSVAERLREAVETTHFRVKGHSTPIRATISLGIAVHPHDVATSDDLVPASDVAIHHAKLSGRNRVVSALEVLLDTKLRYIPADCFGRAPTRSVETA